MKMHLLTHLHCILGLEGVRDLIVKVAAEMKARKTIGHEEIYPTVYALCAIHGCKNAKITDSNMRSLVVQWAKCGNDEDVQIINLLYIVMQNRRSILGKLTKLLKLLDKSIEKIMCFWYMRLNRSKTKLNNLFVKINKREKF